MSDIVLEVNNLSKKYCLNLKKSMYYGCVDICRDIFKLKAEQSKLRKSEFWSVKNASFSLKKGECMGIIGPNGAGKSTLLKILNGILKPDTGTVKYSGTMGALIEVGAGFHPVLTGRENIYINASIMGLSRTDINKKIDEIIEFSELEGFLDTPVKNYSSGMRVKLGFSIAAHLDPTILLIDEVLAVGDISFQAKCKNKIADLIAQGTSAIFISHNMTQVSYLCPTSLLINKGDVLFQGDTLVAIDKYKELMIKKPEHAIVSDDGKVISKCAILNQHGKEVSEINPGEPIKIIIHTQKKMPKESFVYLVLKSAEGTAVSSLLSPKFSETGVEKDGKYTFEIDIPEFNFMPGLYFFDILIAKNFSALIAEHKINNAISIHVQGGTKQTGFVKINHNWIIHNDE